MMKDFFQKTSTTSIIAVLIVVGAMMFFFAAHFFPSEASETTETQIVQGLFGAMMLAAGYYFGQSKNRSQSAATGPSVDTVENMTVNNPPPAEGGEKEKE